MDIKKIILLAAILVAPLAHCANKPAVPALQTYMNTYHDRLNPQIKLKKTVVILGDSISQAWLTGNYQQGTSVNFSVGGSTSEDVLNKISRTSVCKAGSAQLMVGINDIYQHKYRDLANNTRLIAKKLNCDKLTWLGVMHPTSYKFDDVMHAEIDKINERIKSVCRSMQNCTYVEPVKLFGADYLPDGLHPSADGYAKMNTNIIRSHLKIRGY